MTVGLPGTGIGGLFYILLSVVMPFLHLFRVLSGTHKLHHLKTWILSVFLSMGILLSLYGEAKAIIWFAKKIDSVPLQFGQSLTLNATSLPENAPTFSEGTVLAAISPALVLLPFIILFTLLIFVQILRFIVHGCRPSRSVIHVDIGDVKLPQEKIA